MNKGNHAITFDNVIKPKMDWIIWVNENWLFNYDSNMLFGQHKDALRPSAFS